MNKNKKIEVITLGCSKNIVDSERLINQLKANDFTMVDSSDEAGTIVINTCGFIDAAKEESINTILHAVELKKQGKINKVVVAGCLSERYKEELIKEIPEVDSYFGTEAFKEVVENLGGDYKYELLGERQLLTPSHFAYFKISEGCDNPCSFCAIPIMRGKHKSKKIEEILHEAQILADGGVKEIIIIGQDTTDYGIDIYGKRNLSMLLQNLSDIDGLEWIRLLYAYPSHFPDDVLEQIKFNPKICKYIDMPLQHISDNVLRSMRRGITERRTRELLEKIRKFIPDITLRTTFIVGYPTETEKEYKELTNFIKEIEFDRLGIFAYSQEENTPAFILGDPVDNDVKEERRLKIMELQKGISLKRNRSFIEKKMRVIVDDIEGKKYITRSERDAPEVDGEVIVDAEDNLLKIGKFYNVEIYDCNEYDLYGKLNTSIEGN